MFTENEKEARSYSRDVTCMTNEKVEGGERCKKRWSKIANLSLEKNPEDLKLEAKYCKYVDILRIDSQRDDCSGRLHRSLWKFRANYSVYFAQDPT